MACWVKNRIIKNHNFQNEFISVTLKEISLSILREREEFVWDLPDMDYEFELTADVIFDDHCNTVDGKTPETCLYLECVRKHHLSPSGCGTEYLEYVLNSLKQKDMIVCLYALPLAKPDKLYSKKQIQKYLPKLKNVYSQLGFQESIEDEHVMYYYT